MHLTFLDGSCSIEQIPKSAVANPNDLELWLKVDDELRQKGSTSDMIFKIPSLISYISSIMTLMEGDVILTGTPEGVGPVRPGQKIKAGITGLVDVEFDVQKRKRSSFSLSTMHSH
ncbi:Os03g0421700 [Oryza sativa Japonica Group]|nr:Os03g0421700 [Oryza sativa Japonica Group]|eukprot:NP_001173477.1 Os03g0421700 [Oryza sativa Japonica Group]